MATILHIILLVLVKSAISLGDDFCPTSCNCTDNSAICTSTKYTRFEGNILTLKISKPLEPLSITGPVFNASGLVHLNSISIEDATILSIDGTALESLSALSSLSINNSTIPAIGASLLAKVERLRMLRITNSALRKFEYVASNVLEELDLTGNALTAITQNTFAALPQLSFINLDKNPIKSVDPKAFTNVINLQDVIITNNNLTALPRELFKNNIEIVSINLSNNPLKAIGFKLNEESDLEKLVLQSCQLHTMEDYFTKSLTLLNHLDVSNNSLNLSAGFFDQMKDLEFLDLSRNNLTSLDPSIFKFNSKLEKIILDHNNFKELPELQTTDHFITDYFSCNHCGLSQIPQDAFRHFPRIVTLTLAHNQLTNLVFLQKLPNLVKLDLSRNSIARIPVSTFSNCADLKTLNLAGNLLKSVDTSIFLNNFALKSLDISFCGLRQLWQQPAVASLKSLLQLKVVNNSLTSITTRDLEIIPSLQELDLSHNPLHCTEILNRTTAWLAKHNVQPLLDSLEWRTHEELNDYVNPDKATSSWRFLIKDRCLDEYYFDNLGDDEEDLGKSRNDASSQSEDIDNTYDDDYEEACDDDIFNSLRFKKDQQSYTSFQELVLMFVATALSVLIIVVNIFLFCYRKKLFTGITKMPRVKIPWLNPNNRHKHSGSVYQPLSEEKCESSTVINTIPHAPVHGL